MTPIYRGLQNMQGLRRLNLPNSVCSQCQSSKSSIGGQRSFSISTILAKPRKKSKSRGRISVQLNSDVPGLGEKGTEHVIHRSSFRRDFIGTGLATYKGPGHKSMRGLLPGWDTYQLPCYTLEPSFEKYRPAAVGSWRKRLAARRDAKEQDKFDAEDVVWPHIVNISSRLLNKNDQLTLSALCTVLRKQYNLNVDPTLIEVADGSKVFQGCGEYNISLYKNAKEKHAVKLRIR